MKVESNISKFRTLAEAIKKDTNKLSAIAGDVTEIKGRIEELHLGESGRFGI